jgi:uncharacterized membrane protein
MGDVTELTLRLALLFLPGILAALLVERLVPTRDWSTARLALYSLVLGLICYLIYALLKAAYVCHWPPSIHLFRSLTVGTSIDLLEIICTTAISPLVGILVSLSLNSHWINRFGKFIHVSDKFGALDVWARTFNSSETTWVVVRDLEENLAYDGWVEAFSDTYDANEVFLRDVRVFQVSTSSFLYELEAVYLTRPKDKLTIEIRKKTNNDGHEEGSNGR